jgi:hypothetical protein
VQFVGGSAADAVRYTHQMYEITAGESRKYQIPASTSAARPPQRRPQGRREKPRPRHRHRRRHKQAGVGQVGAGIVAAPMGPFAKAYDSLAKSWMRSEWGTESEVSKQPTWRYRQIEDLEFTRSSATAFGNRRSFPWLAGRGKIRLGSQIRRSSNISPAQLAEKNDDRHVRNKIESVNRSRAIAGPKPSTTFHGPLAGYESKKRTPFSANGIANASGCSTAWNANLERQLPESDRRWPTVQRNPTTTVLPDFPSPDL